MIVGLCGVVLCYGKGIKVSPAEIILQDVIPGQTYDLNRVANVKITIYNEFENEQIFTIGCYRSNVVGKIMKGYTEIPDTKWVSFDKKEISIPGNKRGFVNVFLKIPEEDKYYNQNWCCYIGVLGKAEYGISLGLYIRLRIETKEKEIISEKPYGEIAVVPSKVMFKDEKEKKIRIYNNTERKGNFKIYTFENPEETRRYISSGYKIFPESCLFHYKKQIEIPPKGEKEIILRLNCGNKLKKGRYEKVFFVEGEEKTIFFRVRKENEK